MALWTPSNLAVAPRVWWSGDNATFNGSNQLTAWSNAGSEGGSATIGGTPTKSTLNSLNGVRIDAAGEKWSRSLAAWGTGGKLYVFAVLAKLSASAPNESGLLSKGAVSPTSGLSFGHAIDAGGTNNIGFIGNGYTQTPLFDTDGGGNQIPDTNAHLLAAQAGTTNELRLDGSTVTLVTNNTGACPNFSAGTWDFGQGWGGTSEHANSDIFQLILLDYFPTTAERQQIEGWAAHKYGLTANLPADHPYKTTAPSTGGTLSATLGAATLSSSATLALSGSLSSTLASATLSSTATLTSLASGSVNTALDAATLSASATLAISGTLSATLGAATLSSAATIAKTGALSGTLANATLSASGQLAIAATLSATLDAATTAGSGTLPITATLGASLEAASLSATGSALSEVTATLSVTLSSATASAVGRILLWQAVSATAETWTTTSPTSETWTPVAATSETWTAA